MEFLLLCMGIPLGLLVGLLPGLGASVTLILVYPFIEHMSFDLLLAFYAVFITSTQFSGSVIALWVGLPGEVTSMPVLKERPGILANSQLNVALRRTAIGSASAAVLSLFAVGLIFFVGFEFFFLLRTEIIALILFAMLGIGVFWGSNKLSINTILVVLGVILSNVGYQSYNNSEFLTFGQSWLYGGIPFIPALLGMYAVPALLELLKNNFSVDMAVKDHSRVTSDPLLLPILRGSAIGFVLGLVPLIGVIISSTMSHYAESKLRSSTSLSRITAAESANNAAVVSVLVPLLVYGIAIQPSEAIILSILHNNLWTTQHISTFTFVLGFFCILTSVAVCYMLCTHYAEQMVLMIKNHKNLVFASIVSLLIFNIFYLGTQTSMGVYYLATFLIFLLLGGIAKWIRIDLIPLVFMFIVGNYIVSTSIRLHQMYF